MLAETKLKSKNHKINNTNFLTEMNCLLLYPNQVHSLFVMITVSKDEEKRSRLGGMLK